MGSERAWVPGALGLEADGEHHRAVGRLSPSVDLVAARLGAEEVSINR